MAKQLLKQLLRLCVTLIAISLAIYIIFSNVSGSPAELVAGVSASSEQLNAISADMGLDENLFSRYLSWIKGALTADFGTSTQYSLSVGELIKSRLPITSHLAIMACFLIIVVALPLGILAAYKSNSIVGIMLNSGIIFGLSIPSYILGMLIIWCFGILFRFFTPGEFGSYSVATAAYWRSLLFPALAIAIPNICIVARFLKSAILEQMEYDYVKTARSKGAGKLYIIIRHIFRNAITSVITIFGMIAAEILAGSIIIEQVFNIPGIGKLLIGGINNRDFPIVITLVLYISIVVVVVNFIAEVLIRLNDPRIGLSDER